MIETLCKVRGGSCSCTRARGNLQPAAVVIGELELQHALLCSRSWPLVYITFTTALGTCTAEKRDWPGKIFRHRWWLIIGARDTRERRRVTAINMPNRESDSTVEIKHELVQICRVSTVRAKRSGKQFQFYSEPTVARWSRQGFANLPPSRRRCSARWNIYTILESRRRVAQLSRVGALVHALRSHWPPRTFLLPPGEMSPLIVFLSDGTLTSCALPGREKRRRSNH